MKKQTTSQYSFMTKKFIFGKKSNTLKKRVLPEFDNQEPDF